MPKMTKKPLSGTGSFVEGKAGKETPKPKSLTPKVNASGNKKRAGTYGKSLKSTI